MVARHDLAKDPELLEALLTARRGTAFFGRKLNELPDDELRDPSLLPGWTKAHLVAHVGYNARAIARLIEWANTGVETPMYSSPDARSEEIELGSSLPPAALRNLYEHSAIHLNVEWRDTPPEAWSHEVKTAQGRLVPASETVWMRTREVWMHAVDLDNGATFEQIPRDVLHRLLIDITGAWTKRGEGTHLVLRDVLNDNTYGNDEPAGHEVISGPLPQLVAWAAGRPFEHLESSQNTQIPAAPRWI